MPDNLPPPEGATPASPARPEGRRSGSLPPPLRKTAPAGRVVVTLSSVAKMPPPLVAGGFAPAPIATAPPRKVPTLLGAPGSAAILPARESTQRAMTAPPNRQPQFNRTMEVKLPPKSGVLPKLTTLSSMPLAPASSKPAHVSPTAVPPPAASAEAPPPALPTAKPAGEEKAPGLRSAALKLKPLLTGTATEEESIFPAATGKPAPAGWKQLKPGELPTEPSESDALSRAPRLRDEVIPESTIDLLPPPVAAQKATTTPPAPPLVTQPSLDSTDKHGLPPPVGRGDMPAPGVPHPPALLVPPAAARQAAPPLADDPIVTKALNPSPNPAVAPPPALPKQNPPKVQAEPPNPPPAPVAIPPSGMKPIPEAPDVSALPAATIPPVIPLQQSELPIASAKKEALTSVTALPASSAPTPTRKENPGPVRAPARRGLFASRKKAKPTLVPAPAKISPVSALPPVVPLPLERTADKAAVPPLPPKTGGVGDGEAKSPQVRSARSRKRRLVGTIAFYVIFIGLIVPTLFLLAVHFSSETRIEGQIIPPPGTMLSNEAWIVSDFRPQELGIADDLAAERAPKVQEIQERQDHVQRAQADIAAREERIRLLQEQIQAAKDEIATVIKRARDEAQKVWDGPGAALEREYNSHLSQLKNGISARARSLNLKYTVDDTYQSPEVWANAYRLALYQTPPNVDGAKEHQWIEDQLKAWRGFTKSFDDRKEKLRLEAAQIQLSPTTQVTEVNAKIDDLKHRVDSTQAEEDPLKTELLQAQTDLTQAQTAEASLDAKYYQELYALPESNITTRLPLAQNGRFSWRHLEKDSVFSRGDKSHSYYLFARAVRNKDGRQYWVLEHFTITQNEFLQILIEPTSFISTRVILRPDLPSDEAAQ